MYHISDTLDSNFNLAALQNFIAACTWFLEITLMQMSLDMYVGVCVCVHACIASR